MNDFNLGALRIITTIDEQTVTVRWIGQSDERDPSRLLTPYLNSIVDEVQGRNVTIEYQQLEFMNSSSVRVILQFIATLNMRGVNTTITYDSASAWQNASFKVLKTFCIRMSHVNICPLSS